MIKQSQDYKESDERLKHTLAYPLVFRNIEIFGLLYELSLIVSFKLN